MDEIRISINLMRCYSNITPSSVRMRRSNPAVITTSAIQLSTSIFTKTSISTVLLTTTLPAITSKNFLLDSIFCYATCCRLVGLVFFLRYHYCYLPDTLPYCIVIYSYVSMVCIVVSFWGAQFKILQNVIKQRKSNIRCSKIL